MTKNTLQKNKANNPDIDSNKAESMRANNVFKKINSAYFLVVLISVLAYINTIGNGYAIDDGLVITENKYTQKGFSGILDILTHDAFYGCLGADAQNLVQGGRYRPLSIVTFAIEHQIFGQSPSISHAINVVLFAICNLLLFKILLRFQRSKNTTPDKSWWSWPFWATIIFAVHPIHTEVVANIKGRDEILALLFSLTCLWYALKYVDTKKIGSLFFASGLYFIALLSKENSITFLAIVPISFYFFCSATRKEYVKTIIALAIPTAIFLTMRQVFAASTINSSTAEILNNPFLLADTSQRFGTILYTWGRYFLLLIAPIKLSHDYYFNQIPYVSFISLESILPLIFCIGLLWYSFKNIKQKTIAVYSILFYFITFSVVSNLLFSVGILMNERFVFISSISFCIIVAQLLKTLSIKWNAAQTNKLIVLLLLLFSAKTIARNLDWKSNLTLLAADVKTSPNSAKANASYAGLLYEESLKELDTATQKEQLSIAYEHARIALNIYPNYSDAIQIMGNIQYRYKKNYNAAIAYYQKAFELNGANNHKLLRNLGMAYIRNGQGDSAIIYLRKSNALNPNEYATIYSLGEAFDINKQADSALFYYKQSNILQSRDGIGYYKIGIVYARQLGQLTEGIKWLSIACEKEPQNVVFLEDLAVAIGISGDADGAIDVANKIITIQPKYLPAYRILSASYQQKGNQQLAAEFLKKANGQ